MVWASKKLSSKISSGWAYFIVSIVGIAFSALIIFSAYLLEKNTPQNLIESASVAFVSTSTPVEQVGAGLPIRLVIPKIHINALVEDVGTTSDGAMAVPKGPVDVAWFDLGPRPGEIGSSVIAGHEGWKDGIAAVFDNLNQLKTGDEVSVENASGTAVTFVVTKTQLYDQKENAVDIFTSNDGLAHLNLITCEGTWNAAKQSYSNRLVVFADEIVSTSSPK